MQTIEVEDLTLGNIGGPEFREDFAKALEELYGAFLSDEDYGGDKMTAKVQATFTVVFNAETMAAEIKATVRTTLPKRRARTTWARARGGRFLVDSDETGGRQGRLVSFEHGRAVPAPTPHAVADGSDQE